MKEIVKLFISTCVTGGAMYCIYDLEVKAIGAGLNGTQFMYVIAAIGLLGGVTMAPVLEIMKSYTIKKKEEAKEGG